MSSSSRPKVLSPTMAAFVKVVTKDEQRALVASAAEKSKKADDKAKADRERVEADIRARLAAAVVDNDEIEAAAAGRNRHYIKMAPADKLATAKFVMFQRATLDEAAMRLEQITGVHVTKQTIQHWVDALKKNPHWTGEKQPIVSTKNRVVRERGDKILKTMLQKIRSYGGVIHLREVVAIYTAIMLKDKALFEIVNMRRGTKILRGDDGKPVPYVSGGPVVSRAWAQRKLALLGFSIRKGTTAVDEVRVANFLNRLARDIKTYNVTVEMIYNADQSGYYVEGTAGTTFDVVGASNVPITNYGEKQQITAVECMKANGELLPTQIIFPGSTTRVHPETHYDNIIYDHSKNHWANVATTINWINKVLIPNVKKTRLEINKSEQVALLLVDVWHGHFDKKVLKLLAKNRIKVIPIEPGMTAELQPCDQAQGVNRLLKQRIYAALDSEFVSRICKQVNINFKVNTNSAYDYEAADVSGIGSFVDMSN